MFGFIRRFRPAININYSQHTHFSDGHLAELDRRGRRILELLDHSNEQLQTIRDLKARVRELEAQNAA